jgi:hypothetical protein
VFETELRAKFQRIFGIRKMSFDRPGESQEQEGGFIEITNVRPNFREARQIAHVQGTLHVFANSDKMPFGYLAKRIEHADPADKRALFFQTEENRGTFGNIVERSMSFVFLFDSQYDPALGTLNELNTTVVEN